MNGYTPTTPYKTRIQNLLYNIPVTERPKAISDAWAAAKQEIENANKFDFERHLTAIVRGAQVEPSDDELANAMSAAAKDDWGYPLTFSGGEVDEARPYKPHTSIVEDELPY